MRMIPKPAPGEYPDYAEMYIKLLPDDGLILKHLADNFQMVKGYIYKLPTEKLLYKPAPDKWTVKEILVHIVDDERIFSYRALRFARGEKQSMPGFDQDDYARYSGANKRDLDNIFAEYEAVRRATIALFDGFAGRIFDEKGRGQHDFSLGDRARSGVSHRRSRVAAR